MADHKICERCEFFTLNAELPDRGICSRYPPAVFPTGPSSATSFWPIVRCEQSCGEWKQRLYVAKEIPPMRSTMQ